MNFSSLHAIHDQYRETQSLILHIVEGLDAQYWSASPSGGGTPLAYHVWQIAREADVLHSLVYEATGRPIRQVWMRDGVAQRWGFNVESLGLLQTGIGMNDDEVSALPWPAPREIITYLRDSFNEVNAALASVEHQLLQVIFTQRSSAVFGGAGTIERATMSAVANGNRHLGIIGWISASTPVRHLQVPQMQPHTSAGFVPVVIGGVADA